MAGTIIADFIRADANKLSLNVGNTIIASVNSMVFWSNTGNVMISSSGQFSGSLITNGTVTDSKLSLLANDSNIKTALNASGNAPIYACRAWVNFNGMGTVAINASGNVTSITDNGTGDYTVNFTTAMDDANYAIGFGHQYANSSTDSGISPQLNADVTNPATASSARILMRYSGGNYDCRVVCVTINR